MKQIFVFLSATLMMIACTSSNDVEEITTTDIVTVNINLSGDVVTSSTTPLSRAINKETTYYGVNIQSAESGFSYNVTGVFDNANNISVDLVNGHKYTFTCFAVKGIENPTDWNGNPTNNFGSFPFYKYKFEDIGRFVGGNYLVTGSENKKVDASYGQIEYTPTSAGSIDIDLKRVSMGVKWVINPPSDGTVSISIDDYYSYNHYYIYGSTIKSTDNQIKDEFLLMAADPYTAWDAAVTKSFNYKNRTTGKNETVDDYYETLSIAITWVRENGSKETYKTQYVPIKRNAMTTINISPTAEGSGANGVRVHADTSMTDGDTNIINVSSGEITNTVVHPNNE